MPRIILKRRPSSRNDSPGLSSVPASIDPIITLDAPAASAFTMSPEYLMPPSAMTGTSPRSVDGVEDRRELRNADAGHHSRRADGARTDPHLDRVDSAFGERRRAFPRRDVAGDELRIREEPRAPATSRAARLRCARAPCR